MTHKSEFGARLADVALILTYVRGWSTTKRVDQSAHTMRAYKATPPAQKCAQDLAYMVAAASTIHEHCIPAVLGSRWESITFVPSAKTPGASHPVAELARTVRGVPRSGRFLLSLADNFHELPDRAVRADRFTVEDRYRDRVEGKHVLLVEDTWVTGSKAQSAAITLHDAGAAKVTILCVARWCRDDWTGHKEFLDSLDTPYDAYVCPVAAPNCPYDPGQ
ncbi:phosphoribosyltransferase [Saccharothrix obliqua]|uniref:phosphoribosyltransferase n=1 Tax=Saccharothrix obliqua TaxID=2861747 RepID=UPI001C5FC482|nr:phosphoribosyltransferase [Saccharothrix obliqua]MBW4718884.1 hypothetical protein [Saccharothrix obliqua]